jgi:hypothetical protein
MIKTIDIFNLESSINGIFLRTNVRPSPGAPNAPEGLLRK